jgi:hypothetical protein
MSLQWRKVELNREGVQSPSLPALDADASWGKGRYRIRPEREGDYRTGTYAVTRITPTNSVWKARGYTFARGVRSLDEAKLIAERDNDERIRGTRSAESPAGTIAPRT